MCDIGVSVTEEYARAESESHDLLGSLIRSDVPSQFISTLIPISHLIRSLVPPYHVKP